MVNALTRKTGLTLGPIILETLVKHYFERISKENDSEETTKLRKEELLYDEAFNIIKSFMEASTKHTVEELQEFSNTRTPSPPWVHVVRLLVPMSCCDEAATYLIKALGGDEVTKRLVGGTKWWQVRGVKGVDGEWIVAKKDWQEAKKKQKARGLSMETPVVDSGNTNQELPPQYQPEMDEMRCILYAHGGGYYFGSIDQERYSIQRLARKINGRVFTINYRLAPQYPFPCAIQDMLAAYLYLIQPPPGALHTPVSPSSIVFGGDSAGGGLCIATLQVIRDAGLPLPAGAVLISPWCDLTHSFPSIHLNTATDIIPQFGLSFHKPSTLWPPPPDEVTTRVQHSLRERIREAIHPKTKDGRLDVPDSGRDDDPNDLASRPTTPDYTVPVSSSGHERTLHLGGAGSVPIPVDGVRSQRVSMVTQKGEELAIDQQVHMYAPNYLLTHPLVSPVVSYLGGLPSLLVIASDKEVLRDEIIYFAHKAAHPDKYPVKPEARTLYPVLEGIEQRYSPTKVHLQVYDDCAHTLPVLFAFTTPGKYCFRAMATFIKYVTGVLPKPTADAPMIPEAAVTTSPASTQTDLLISPPSRTMSQENSDPSGGATDQIFAPSALPAGPSTRILTESPPTSPTNPSMPSTPPSIPSAFRAQRGGTDSPSGGANADRETKSLRRVLSSRVNRASVLLRRAHTTSGTAGSSASSQGRHSTGSSDVGGPRFHGLQEKSEESKATAASSSRPAHRYAGVKSAYDNGLGIMIRERVSTQGLVRPLEPESELDAFHLPPELIGEISELAVRRYVEGTAKFEKKFGKTAQAIEKARRKNLERARQDTMRNMAQLHTFLNGNGNGERKADDTQPQKSASTSLGARFLSRTKSKAKSKMTSGDGSAQKAVIADTPQGVKEGLAASGSWPWAWALDADENPPPSSIVSRRDTEEARRLAKIADQAVFMDEEPLSANNLWSIIVNFLTVTPERDGHKHKHKHKHGHSRQTSMVDTTAQAKKDASAQTEANNGDSTIPGGEHETVSCTISPEKPETISRGEKMRSRFAWLVAENRKSHGRSASVGSKAETGR